MGINMVELLTKPKYVLCVRHDPTSRLVSVEFDDFNFAKVEGQAFANDYWYGNIWIEQDGKVLETIRG